MCSYSTEGSSTYYGIMYMVTVRWCRVLLTEKGKKKAAKKPKAKK